MALKTNRAYGIPPMQVRPSKRQAINDGLVDVLRCFPDGAFRSVMHGGIELDSTNRDDVEQTAVGYVGSTRGTNTTNPQFAERYVPGGSEGEACTVFALCVKTAAGTQETDIFKIGDDANGTWRVGIDSGHTNVIGHCYTSGSGSVTAGPFTALAMNDVFSVSVMRSAWSTESGFLMAFLNGTLEGIAFPFSSSIAPTNFDPEIYLGRDVSTPALEPPIKVAFIAIWNKRVLNHDLAQLAGDPYMLFRDSSPDLSYPIRPFEKVHGCAEITHSSATAVVTAEGC